MTAAGESDSALLDLPSPDVAAQARSERLVRCIDERIQASGGVIGFDRFMELALYQPGLGYYAADAAQFGAAGDFVTAPEISPLFGQCLARQLDDLMRRGCRPALLEFGAGSGRLCADLMKASPAIERYSILELSAALRQRQQALLAEQLDARSFARIEWLDRLPVQFRGIVVANEVLDAMPVNLLHKHHGWRELGVRRAGDGLGWHETPAGERLLAAIAAIEAEVGVLPEDYRCELNLRLPGWFEALAGACSEAVLLAIDYGFERAEFYRPERRRGSLSCHYRHRVHDDPLWFPGLQDITAFVDFDACADAALAAGFDLHGLVSQRDFLFANGLLEFADNWQREADSERQFAIAQQVKTLSLPEEMGSRFRVLAISRGLELDLPVFSAGRARG